MKKEIKAHQSGFKAAMAFLTPLRYVVSTTFGQKGSRKNFSRCLSYCLNVAIDKNGDHPQIDPERVKISNGNLDGVSSAQVSLEDDVVRVNFDPSIRTNGHADDRVWMCIYADGIGVSI